MLLSFDPKLVYRACNVIIRKRAYGAKPHNPGVVRKESMMWLVLEGNSAYLVGGSGTPNVKRETQVMPEQQEGLDELASADRNNIEKRFYTWEILAEFLKKKATQAMAKKSLLQIEDDGYKLLYHYPKREEDQEPDLIVIQE